MARVVEGVTFHNPLYSPFDLSRRRHDLFGQMLAGTLPEARDRTARTDRRAQNPSRTEDRGAYARHPLLPLPRGRRTPPPRRSPSRTYSCVLSPVSSLSAASAGRAASTTPIPTALLPHPKSLEPSEYRPPARATRW